GSSGNDVAAFVTFATRSLAGNRALAESMNGATEQNSYFGWPVVIATVGIAIALWRMTIVRALSIVIAVAAVLSLGSELIVDGTFTGIAAPWKLVAGLPLLDSVLESRIAMICVPAIAILFALAVGRMRSQLEPPWQKAPRRLWIAALVAILLPTAPMPFATDGRQPVPAFFTQGVWRHYAPDGGVIVPVPIPDLASTEVLHWQTSTDLGFRIPEGYFVGPSGPDGRGTYGAVPRPTTLLLRDVRDSGETPKLTAAQKRQAHRDLRHWDADAVVLNPQWHDEALRGAVEQVLGEPRFVGGVWVWRAR
ncbi:MAG TPA: glycosyl transferase, partial [Stackebrandtia sp.]|nr:glycosyl transferase [Stackebrandtia sp.]